MDKKAYQKILMAHYKSPVGLGTIGAHYAVAKGFNPLCGDEIRVGALLQNNCIDDIKFQARACSICVASASIMSQLLRRQPIAQLAHFHQSVERLLKEPACAAGLDDALRPLTSISGMRSRHKCALLGWEALRQACQTHPLS